MKIVVSHLEHHLNIYKYVDDLYSDNANVVHDRLSCDEEDWIEFMNRPFSKLEQYKLKKNHKLEQWHLEEAFRKIGKYCSQWWD